MGRLLLVFFIFVLLCSCGDNPPKGVLPKETMVPLLTDLHIADGYASSMYGPQSSTEIAAVYKALYKKYSTDSLGLRKSLSYYSRNPDELQLIYKDVEKRIISVQKAEQERVARVQREELRKAKLLEAKEKRKTRFAEFRKKFSKGKYDFGASVYKTPADAYLKPWKRPLAAKKKPVTKKADSLKTDSVKRRLLLKKEKSK